MSLAELIKTPQSRLSLILWLVAAHSILVGLGLIVRPTALPQLFAFKPCSERFFTVQGGIFHILMAIAYIIAVLDVDRGHRLIVFSIAAKGIATIFLISYFFAVDRIWLVLISGVFDGVMALVMYLVLRSYLEAKQKPDSAPGAV